ncbi:MAG: DNA polymerase III subunit gamma/tau [Faecalibacterium sp.]|nr:DNA polymerase III subunit gamma/tau [Ruminococcus sp.]MCM1392147.1 DNA polymerase III subunit gamma/tau [Ruminococcus sp.]MCM1485885.1 DNA polymerase III subunit gamma/tau [Faecalibacterium sp.]
MYQVLYRKYRPKVFSDVVGQDHITTTLSREIETGKLSHAYLFTGSRGTGKTTCAKILAKAVNCLHPVNGNPCNECEICKGIESGAILDVVEIDAASNNGVDNIRDIRDESNFAPASCKYRVYIIDEVHMLSIGAFNALLKTLEEPPAHVKFILATTEVHKLPVTILSRCQRFDFKRVSPEAMTSRMMQIADMEGFTLEDEAAALIARLADGGMRDALSTLDQCMGRGDTVTSQIVYNVAGVTGKDHLFELTSAIGNSNQAEALSIINKLHGDSFDMERLCADMIDHFRSLMIVKTIKQSENVLVCTREEIENYKRQSEEFTLEAILYSIDLLQNSMANIKRGVNRRIEMEMTVIRLSSPKLDTDNKALLRRIADLELAIKTGGIKITAAQPQTHESNSNVQSSETKKAEATKSAASKPDEYTAETAQHYEQDNTASDTASVDVDFTQWAQVLNELSDINKPLWGILIGSTAYIRNDFVLIKSENPTFSSFIKTGTHARDVKESIFRVTGRKYRLGIYNPSSASAAPASKPKDPLENLISKAKDLGVNVTISD